MFFCKEFISRGTKRCLHVLTYTECHKIRLPKTFFQKSVPINLSDIVKHDRITNRTHVQRYLISYRGFRITYFINVFVTTM
jgi:hypothetical protein